jgi:HPt (histidine-containing phosphotransfer) domain-containing protein
MDDTQVIDPAAHDRLIEWGGSKLLREMVRLFLENTGARMEMISSGFETGEAGLVEHGAHSLKSSAANVGAEMVRALAQQLETLASRGDVDAARDLHEPLRAAVTAADARLRDMIEGFEE